MTGQHRFKPYAIAVILALHASALTAQQIDPPPGPAPPLSSAAGNEPFELRISPRRFLGDEYRIWTSPFRPRSYTSRTMKRYVVPFLLLTGGLIASDRKTAELLPNTPAQVKWSGRVSQMGASYTMAGFSAATYLVGKSIGNAHASKTGLLGLEAFAHTQIVVQGLKLMTRRERPLMNDQEGRFWKGGTSFPSGHAASAFAIATVFAYEYRDHLAIPIAAYSAAGIIAASRTSARRHFVGDVVVGASLGFLIGRFVYRNHRDPNFPGSPAQPTSRLTPEVGFGSGGVTLNWSF